MSTWKRDLASGLVILVPVLITLYIIYWIFVRLAALPVLEETIDPALFGGADQAVFLAAVARVVFMLVIFLLLVLAVGYLMRTAAGSVFESLLDSLVNRLPGLRVVYNASKMAVETALTGTEDLQAPVKIEPWEGMRMTAFKTGKQTDDGREVVFMPTAPNITTGFVIEVDPGDLTETDEKVEEALTRVLSAGFGEQTDQSVPIEVEEQGTRPGSGDQ